MEGTENFEALLVSQAILLLFTSASTSPYNPPNQAQALAQLPDRLARESDKKRKSQEWSFTHKTTSSGRPVAFCWSAPSRCEANTPTLIKFFAQLNVRTKRSSVDGAMISVVESNAALGPPALREEKGNKSAARRSRRNSAFDPCDSDARYGSVQVKEGGALVRVELEVKSALKPPQV